ncbi:hypothetical protein IAD21_03766 [Abditibacteriota bacterium]|nr:hypothetical protein IAD21_03766 [Abditibacteriota bacterium]
MKQAAILNSGSGAWAFESLAQSLSHAFGVPIVSEPAKRNFLLAWDGTEPPEGECFVPYGAIQCANDKRQIAEVFKSFGVPCTATFLFKDSELEPFLRRESARQWLLKYPISCGGAGHRFIQAGDTIPTDWPRPLVVQEFIALPRPEVFRFYSVAGVLFGWNVRRFPATTENPSPFVAHARGAHYELAGTAPPRAVRCARRALEATGLWQSWGCVDMVPSPDGRWLALEVGTDGLWSHIDRDLKLPQIEQEIETRLARAFKAWCERA